MSEPVVVVGASAGGVEALRTLVATLPADFPAPVLVVVHVQPTTPSLLPEILSRSGPLPAAHARHGEPLRPGRILIAPPDNHLLIQDGTVALSRGPRVNRHRPAVDPLFISAARVCGPAAIGVILSGALDDGAHGAAAIAAQDGTVLVQSPADARVPSMPVAVLAAVRRARAAPADELGDMLVALLTRLSARTPPARRHDEVPDPVDRWEQVVASDDPPDADPLPGGIAAADPAVVDIGAASGGIPAALGCPDCQGGMFEEVDDGSVTWICHVGHRFAADALRSAQQEAVEAALYGAAAKLFETAQVHRRMATAPATGVPDHARRRHLLAALRAQRQAATVQAVIADLADLTDVTDGAADVPPAESDTRSATEGSGA